MATQTSPASSRRVVSPDADEIVFNKAKISATNPPMIGMLFRQTTVSSFAPLATMRRTCEKQAEQIADLKRENDTLQQELKRLKEKLALLAPIPEAGVSNPSS